MGDGRYYTWLQFNTIAYLMLVAVMLLLSMIYIGIKNQGSQRVRYFLIIEGLLFLAVLMGFFEAIIVWERIGYLFRSLQLFSIHCMLMMILGSYCEINIKRMLFTMGIFILLQIGIAFLFQRNPYISAYNFYRVNYTVYYKAWVIVLVSLIYVNLFRTMKLQKSLRVYEKTYKWLLTLSIAIPLGLYILWLYQITFHGIAFHVIILLASISILIVAMTSYSPREIIPASFQDIIQEVHETVLLFDRHKRLIYHNETELTKHMFLHDRSCYQCYKDFFPQATVSLLESEQQFKSLYMKVNDASLYLNLSEKVIKQKNEILGYLMMIDDVTHLELAINELKEKNSALTEAYDQIRALSKNAHSIEAERERQRLMTEIHNFLGHRFAELNKFIENIIFTAKNERVEDSDKQIYEINQAIALSRETLQAIRKTVVSYRESYEKRMG